MEHHNQEIYMSFDSEEIRLKECYAVKKVCKCVQQPITPTIGFYIFSKYLSTVFIYQGEKIHVLAITV